MIKPNLIFSHDWHVQPNCQRSLRAFRLSGALLDRGPAFRSGCPRTCCAHRFRVALRFPAFLREPFKHIELPSQCQADSFPLAAGRSNSLLAVFPACKAYQHDKNSNSDRNSSRPKPSRSAKYQRATNAPRLSRLRLTGVFSWVLQWLVLCGIPDRGSGAFASPDPTNQHHNCFPLPSWGRPEGHREALFLTQSTNALQSHSTASGTKPTHRRFVATL
jgi:hypothetical protein